MISLKKTVFLVIVILIFHSGLVQASNNFVFSVSSNPSINVGYKIGNFVVFTGLDFSYTKSEMKSANPAGSIFLLENKYSVFKLEPSVGLKVFLFKGEISPFLIGNVTKEIPIFAEGSGMYTQSEIKNQNDDYKFNFGTGLDFSIKENLSLGLELGISYFYSQWDSELMENMNEHYLSFSRVTLNYYFL